ncbi:hypothetical protein QJS10_CPB21g01036 [Acorus calamus]|uniref:Secreted protein n=1 Tax=Acorus calamus TaxID=4465 RepID=A0AAV9C3B4_ACOCL|nr:hypothetical protein QJS10_CPB21g01036 [Acorus calamus]
MPYQRRRFRLFVILRRRFIISAVRLRSSTAGQRSFPDAVCGPPFDCHPLSTSLVVRRSIAILHRWDRFTVFDPPSTLSDCDSPPTALLHRLRPPPTLSDCDSPPTASLHHR